VDKGLASAEDRIEAARTRAKDSRITSSEISDKLRNWASVETKERLTSRLEIEGRAERLTGQLATVDLWLETSSESIRGVQRALEPGHLVGIKVDPESLDEVLEKVASVRGVLQQTVQTVDVIRDFTADKMTEAEDSRLLRVTKLVARLLVTIGEIDARLHEFLTRLAELRSDAQLLKAKTNNYILLATMGCYSILAWIGAGQAALCRGGWKHCC